MHIVKVGKYGDGTKYVEFDNGYETPHAHINYDMSISWEWKSKWRIVEDKLPIRIANMKKRNEDTSVEERALAMMKELA